MTVAPSPSELERRITYDEPPMARVVERRDPKAATKPVVYQSPGQPQIANWDAHRALQYGLYANTFVYRCVQVRALALAGLPVRVGADPDKPNDYDTRNPLARLLGPPPGGPNRDITGQSLIAWSLAQLDVTGRVGWELELNPSGTPIALFPLPAPYLKPIPSEGGAGYFSKFQFGRSGEERNLSSDQVFYHWRPRADDVRQPESVMDAARYDISVAVMQDRYDHAFLQNDSRPAAVIIYEGFETEDEDTAFKRQFRGEFQGPDNAGKAMFAEADRGANGVASALHVETLGLSQKDARSIERYDAKLRAICVAFGVPLTVLGDASGRTFANAGEEFHVFWAQTMLALIAEMQNAINLKLAPLFGDNVCWFDITNVESLRPANKFTAPEALQGYDGGLITKNEARNELGLPPIADGDTFRPQVDVVLAPPTNVPRSTVADVPQSVPPLAAAEPARPQRSPSADTAAVPPQDTRAALRRTRATAEVNVHVSAFEHTWARTFRHLFARQAAEVLQRLKGKRGRQATREQRAEPDNVFRRAHWKAVTAEEVENLLGPVFAAGAGRIAGDFGIAFDIETPYVQQFIKSRANQLAGQVTDTTYDQITTALTEGVQAGETIDDIAVRVQHVFDVADSVRAETIARTEVIGAYNGSSATVAGQLPSDVVGGQEWITTEDARTRPEHAAADGEIVPVGQPFFGTGEPMMYPGDPAGSPGNVINCRCTIAFLTPEEMDARRGRVEKRAASALLGMVRPGVEVDELAFRRALREVSTA